MLRITVLFDGTGRSYVAGIGPMANGATVKGELGLTGISPPRKCPHHIRPSHASVHVRRKAAPGSAFYFSPKAFPGVVSEGQNAYYVSVASLSSIKMLIQHRGDLAPLTDNRTR